MVQPLLAAGEPAAVSHCSGWQSASPSLPPLYPSVPLSPSLPLSPPLSTQSVIGEYNNPNGEELVHWIQDHTPQSAVFAGTMPTMATVLLTTGRPVVNHPHYENAGLRCVLDACCSKPLITPCCVCVMSSGIAQSMSTPSSATSLRLRSIPSCVEWGWTMSSLRTDGAGRMPTNQACCWYI